MCGPVADQPAEHSTSQVGVEGHRVTGKIIIVVVAVMGETRTEAQVHKRLILLLSPEWSLKFNEHVIRRQCPHSLCPVG